MEESPEGVGLTGLVDVEGGDLDTEGGVMGALAIAP
jgi:hypothetical protein